jgi:hypothetical protein
MHFLENNLMITNREARGLTGIKSENSMKNAFWRLRDRNLIEQVPGRAGFSSAWRKTTVNGHRKERVMASKDWMFRGEAPPLLPRGRMKA